MVEESKPKNTLMTGYIKLAIELRMFQNINITPTVKYGGGSDIFRGCFAASVPWQLAIMNSALSFYPKVLQDHI